jgi:repressor LexA
MSLGITKRQAAILDFLIDFTEDVGFSPSIREIGLEFGIRSLRGVTVHLDALERKGFIERGVHARGITVVKNKFGQKGVFRFVPVGAA